VGDRFFLTFRFATISHGLRCGLDSSAVFAAMSLKPRNELVALPPAWHAPVI